MNIFQFCRFYLANNHHLADNISIVIVNLDKEMSECCGWQVVCYIKQKKFLYKQMIIY